MSLDGAGDSQPTWPGDGGARRLFGEVRRACAAVEGLPARAEAGLRVALETLAADPDLARRLTVDPHLGDDDGALEAQRAWIERFGVLLSEAAAGDPRTTVAEPRFLAGFLVGGVRFQIGRLVLSGEAAGLPRLLPGLLEGLLAYYFEPADPIIRERGRTCDHDPRS
ncbi:MAG TPA: hypothetical protein VMF55_13850 [Solirubrobacterales bacterium]|nr:hypothetical protein [Solirubrobacterales bacterium]